MPVGSTQSTQSELETFDLDGRAYQSWLESKLPHEKDFITTINQALTLFDDFYDVKKAIESYKESNKKNLLTIINEQHFYNTGKTQKRLTLVDALIDKYSTNNSNDFKYYKESFNELLETLKETGVDIAEFSRGESSGSTKTPGTILTHHTLGSNPLSDGKESTDNTPSCNIQ
ncbi:hypothetical protein N9X24_01505 [Rickettsiales bacterium]|nr:hypothetical protein [Rickettsiales bacterium]